MLVNRKKTKAEKLRNEFGDLSPLSDKIIPDIFLQTMKIEEFLLGRMESRPRDIQLI